MRKIAGLLLVTTLTLSLLIIGSSFVSQSRASRTWIVDSTGFDADFRSISDAVYSADSGDTIHVRAGTYDGGIHVGKSLTLIGENPQTTVIDSGKSAQYIEPSIEISASNVSISGFGFTGYPQYVFWIQSGSHLTIEGNIIQPSNNCYNPYYTPTAFGLISDGSYNRICKNNMSNVAEGILAVGAGSYDVFSDNNIFGNVTGIIAQADRGYFNNYTIADNTIFGGGAFGILLCNGHNNTVYGNVVGGNYSETLELVSTSNNTICHNIIETSSTYSLLLSNSTHDLFYGNSFLNSSLTFTAAIVSDSWDNGYPVGGNFWRDYKGVDRYNGSDQKTNGTDGIGDTPYAGGWGIVDHYPLMKPPMEFVYQATPSWQLTQLPMPTPTPTPTPSPSPTATSTPIPTDSPVSTQSPSPTITPKPSAKPVLTPTPIAATNTPTPQDTEPPTTINPTSMAYHGDESSWYLYMAIGALGTLSAVLIVILALKTYHRNPKS